MAKTLICRIDKCPGTWKILGKKKRYEDIKWGNPSDRLYICVCLCVCMCVCMSSVSNEVRLSLSAYPKYCFVSASIYWRREVSTKTKKTQKHILCLGVKVYSCPYGSDINGCHWKKGTLFR